MPADLSTTVVIPCRNERGNIRAAIERLGPDDRALLAMRYVAGFLERGLCAVDASRWSSAIPPSRHAIGPRWKVTREGSTLRV